MENITDLIVIFLVPFLFGLAALSFYKPTKKHIKFLLSFSGAFILAMAALHTFPEVFSGDEPFKVGYFFLAGFLLQLVLEFFSQGLEHGHTHTHGHDKKLFPFTVFIGLCIHSLIEGLPLNQTDLYEHAHHATHHHHDEEGNTLYFGVMLHHIPIAITLVTFMVSMGMKKSISFAALLVFTAITPLGMILGDYLILDSTTLSYAQGFVVGMLLHISTTILFEASDGHKFNIAKLSAVLLGFIVAYLSI
ncbi:MAG: ZIP family metal transporter [Bacteroidia bacterium]